MELKTFAEFQKLLDQVQARKELLDEIAELNRELADKTVAFDEAILEGAPRRVAGWDRRSATESLPKAA